MSASSSFDEIESLFTKYSKVIFTDYIWKHLFDDDVKYEDKDIFEKTEKYLKVFFASYKIEWNDTNRERVHSLVLNSDNAKLIADYFQKTYSLCLESKLKWTPDSSIKRMVNQLIDESVQQKTNLSYYYAKRLLVKYYYDKFIDTKEKDKIISNVMAIFFTNNDMQRLIDETQLSLDSLIGKSYHSLNELLGVKMDPKLFIRKFVILNSFYLGLYKNPQLLDQLMSSQYVSVYKDLIDKINIGVNSINSKNQSDKQVHGKSSNSAEKNEVAIAGPVNSAQSNRTDKNEEVVSTASSASVNKTNNDIQSESFSEDAMDMFLGKIGNKNKRLIDPITKLLSSSADIIKNSEEHGFLYGSLGDICFSEGLEDSEIENLLY